MNRRILKFKVFALAIALVITGFYLYLEPRYVAPILTYHHIDVREEDPLLGVSPENFRRQMRFLARHKYNVISLTELVQAMTDKKKLPRNTVVLTFDDGREDNYIWAFPLLKKYNFPATIFVIVDSLNKPGFLNNAQIREMIASGIIDIESHTLSHCYISSAGAAELEREIGGSKKELESRFNKKVNFFAYPLGAFSPQAQEVVKKYGYLGACTTNKGKVQTWRNDDRFALKRIKVKDSWPNLFVFWIKLSGYYNLFRSVKTPP